jgi:hypothetical protein
MTGSRFRPVRSRRLISSRADRASDKAAMAGSVTDRGRDARRATSLWRRRPFGSRYSRRRRLRGRVRRIWWTWHGSAGFATAIYNDFTGKWHILIHDLGQQDPRSAPIGLELISLLLRKYSGGARCKAEQSVQGRYDGLLQSGCRGLRSRTGRIGWRCCSSVWRRGG